MTVPEAQKKVRPPLEQHVQGPDKSHVPHIRHCTRQTPRQLQEAVDLLDQEREAMARELEKLKQAVSLTLQTPSNEHQRLMVLNVTQALI